MDGPKLRELQPDVVITQGLCPVCAVSLEEVEEVWEEHTDTKPEILGLSPTTMSEVVNDVRIVGKALNLDSEKVEAVAGSLDRRIENAKGVAEAAVASGHRPVVAFLEWYDPIFVAGHWTAEMLSRAGKLNLTHLSH